MEPMAELPEIRRPDLGACQSALHLADTAAARSRSRNPRYRHAFPLRLRALRACSNRGGPRTAGQQNRDHSRGATPGGPYAGGGVAYDVASALVSGSVL